MPRPERGATDRGFRDRLLAFLRNRARELELTPQRLQQRLAFERLLARLEGSGEWVLKGGFALELRYGWRHRPTKDVDLRVDIARPEAVKHLRTAIAGVASTDRFTFELGPAEQELQGAPDGTTRLAVLTRVAGFEFARFHIDVSSGDPLVGDPDVLVGSDLLSFAGFPPVRFPAYPVAQHLAEKLHAYSMRRAEANTRVKDLIDMIAIAAIEPVAGDALLASLRATFDARATHSLPTTFPDAPSTWEMPFAQLAGQTPTSPTTDLSQAVDLARQFWDPVLVYEVGHTRWSPERRAWIAK